MKKVLFIGAHYDDIELGCLGTILKFKKEGYDVRIVVATHSGYSDSLKGHVRKRKDAYQESKVIEDYLQIPFIRLNYDTLAVTVNNWIVEKLIDIINDFSPDLVFTHHNNDINTDHVAVCNATYIAAKYVPSILMYQVNNYSTPQSKELPTIFINIDDFRAEKTSILKSYVSEASKMSRWIRELEKRSSYYWWIVGCKFAEGFFTTKFYLC